MKTSKIFGLVVLALFALNTFAFGQQQWNGAQNAVGDISRTGKVGIGISTPGLRLHINGDVDDFVRLSSDGQPQIWDIGIGKAIARGTFFIARSGKSRDFNIDSDGRVGIGTPSPRTTLDVNGNIYIGTDNSTGNGLIAHGGDGGFIQAKFGTNFGIRLKATRVNTGAWQWYNGSNWTDGITLNGGNVGIGTTTPVSKLDVAGGSVFRGDPGSLNRIELVPQDPNVGVELRSGTNGGTPYIDFTNDDITDFDARMILADNDRLVIDGTHLEVNGGILSARASDGVNAGIINWQNLTNQKLWHMTMRSGDADKLQLYHYDGSVWLGPHLNINPDGNVGIGTTTPQSKLAVNGKITAKEVEVTLQGWSDNVFEENYPLKPLNEVENYINKHKHLPNIPSESKVLENGVNLGEMQAQLLQKIEELTLYMISLEKKNNKLKQELSELRKLLKESRN